MKIQEIRSKSDAELREEADRLRRELYNLRAQAVTNPIEDTTRFRKSRKDVARILTVLTERARIAGKAPVAAPVPAKVVKAVRNPAAAKAAKTEKKGQEG